MWGIRNVPRESNVPQHQGFLQMQMPERVRWRWRRVRWGHRLQTAKKHTADHNDRGRSWRRSAVNHCLDSVLLLRQKTQERRGRRQENWQNGIYSLSIWKWLGKLWFRGRRVWLKSKKMNCISNSVAIPIDYVRKQTIKNCRLSDWFLWKNISVPQLISIHQMGAVTQETFLVLF